MLLLVELYHQGILIQTILGQEVIALIRYGLVEALMEHHRWKYSGMNMLTNN